MSLQDLVAQCLEGLFGLTQAIGFPSYAVAILTVSVIIRLLLLPLNINQLRSTVAMQQIQPQIKEIQERYAGNPEVMNQKMMQLYQDYEINPLSGCLPLLIQFPIMVGLYNGLRGFVPQHPEYYKFLWIDDLSLVDETYLMALLVVISTFLQSYIITGKPSQPMQKYMLFAMPIMMGWMAINFPAYLCIYWLGITVVTILQQLAVNKPMRKKLEERAAQLEEEKRRRDEQRRGHKSKNSEKKHNQPEPAKEPEENAGEEGEANGEAPRKRRRRRR